jgi:hypothetical protein
MSNRSYCAANLRGIVQSMNVYAADNLDSFPIVMPHATAGNYLFAVGGNSKFLCKSDPAGATSPAPISNSSNQFYLDFSSDKQFSYSSAYPWNFTNTSSIVGGWWKNVSDSGLPIMSDIAPQNGTGNPAATVDNLTGSSKAWNSNNHQRDGMNVVFSDAHTDFVRRPDVGPNTDNIWTQNGTNGPSATGTAVTAGTVSGSYGASSTPFDIVMVPIRNVADGTTQ